MSPRAGTTRHYGLRSQIFAALHARFIGRIERVMGPYRRQLLQNVRGDVVELGPGVGCNFAHLRCDVRYHGVEPNPYIRRYCERAAAEHNITATLHAGRAEALPFDDASFDFAIATHVLCSVDDPATALAEIKRVLRPGGCLLFIEHVAAPAGTKLRRRQQFWRRHWHLLTDGCWPDRDTEARLRATAFDDLHIEHGALDFPLVSPHIWGKARRP